MILIVVWLLADVRARRGNKIIDSLCGATGSHVWQKRDVRFRPVAFLWLTRGFENSIVILEKKQEAGRESYLGVPTNF